MGRLTTDKLLTFLDAQLGVWPMAAGNFAALGGVECRDVVVDGRMPVRLQHNPARIMSTAARTDKASVSARPCFLCGRNRPVQQTGLHAEGGYTVLVNPFPIFDAHFTIPADEHVPQLIVADGFRRLRDMWQLAADLYGMAVFYNGPRCGASAPDHFHFQVVGRDALPLLGMVDGRAPMLCPYRVESELFHTADGAVAWFADLCRQLAELPENAGEEEPRMNIICHADGAGVRVTVIPRRAHRPDFYGSGENEVLVSPASVDLAGVMVVPSPDDFHRKLTPEVVSAILHQTCYYK